MYFKRIQPNDVAGMLQPMLSESASWTISPVGILLLHTTEWMPLGIMPRQKPEDQDAPGLSSTIKKGSIVEFNFGSVCPKLGMVVVQPNQQLVEFGMATVYPTVVPEGLCRQIRMTVAIHKTLKDNELKDFGHLAEVIWYKG